MSTQPAARMLDWSQVGPPRASPFADCSELVIGACIEVHRNLGPGLLESAYERCLCHELESRGLEFRQQVALPVRYKDCVLDAGYRLDLIVEQSLVVEVKSVEQLLPVHSAQLITYLRLSGLDAGLLVNFNSNTLRQGLRRLSRRSSPFRSSDLPVNSRPPRRRHE